MILIEIPFPYFWQPHFSNFIFIFQCDIFTIIFAFIMIKPVTHKPIICRIKIKVPNIISDGFIISDLQTQDFFAQKGFKNKPTRCKECRKTNRRKVETEYFKITCSACGQIGEAMFKPSNPDAEIFCKDCFEKKVLAKS